MDKFKSLMKRIGLAVLVCLLYALVMSVLLFVVTPIVLFFAFAIIVNGADIKVTTDGIKSKLKSSVNSIFKGSSFKIG